MNKNIVIDKLKTINNGKDVKYPVYGIYNELTIMSLFIIIIFFLLMILTIENLPIFITIICLYIISIILISKSQYGVFGIDNDELIMGKLSFYKYKISNKYIVNIDEIKDLHIKTGIIYNKITFKHNNKNYSFSIPKKNKEKDFTKFESNYKNLVRNLLKLDK